MKKIAIIGGGASGMVAAITAARNGAKVIIYEKNDRIGKKILATGNGKCNFSNMDMVEEAFFSDTDGFAKEVIRQFDLANTLSFFEELGLCIKNKNGYLYPLSEQATAVLDVLRMELKRLGVLIKTEEEIQKIQMDKKKKGYQIYKDFYDAIILACGSKASLKAGTRVYGYEIAKDFGHALIEPLPSLVQLRCMETLFKGISGVRMDAGVTLIVNGNEKLSERGEVQMTDYGISGIPVFQISRFAAKALAKKQKVTVSIDFLPQFNQKELIDLLEKRLECNAYKTMEEFFYGILPKKIIIMLLKESNLLFSKKTDEITKEEFIKKILSWKNFFVTVISTNPFENAQVCSGGVDVKEIDFCMESKISPGLFFAGEIVDVDGRCGGYNLQWAWSSGYVAGKHAALKG